MKTKLIVEDVPNARRQGLDARRPRSQSSQVFYDDVSRLAGCNLRRVRGVTY